MKYVDEYREGDAARRIAAEIRHEADPKRIYRFMEFCGGHTHVLARWGLTDRAVPSACCPSRASTWRCSSRSKGT